MLLSQRLTVFATSHRPQVPAHIMIDDGDDHIDDGGDHIDDHVDYVDDHAEYIGDSCDNNGNGGDDIDDHVDYIEDDLLPMLAVTWASFKMSLRSVVEIGTSLGKSPQMRCCSFES